MNSGLEVNGWKVGEAVTKWWRGKFLHLYRLRKNCAQCGAEMVIDVTKAAVEGTAKNAGLHIVRCPACRQSSPKGTSRPVVLRDAPAAAPTDVNAEMERLRMINKCMREELDGFYAERKARMPWDA